MSREILNQTEERWRGANGVRLVVRGGKGSVVYANRETAVKMGDPEGAVRHSESGGKQPHSKACGAKKEGARP